MAARCASVSNCVLPYPVTMLNAVGAGPQHEAASQHAPPPSRNTSTSSDALVRFTPTPVGEPSAHVAPATSTQVQVRSAAVKGAPGAMVAPFAAGVFPVAVTPGFAGALGPAEAPGAGALVVGSAVPSPSTP